MEREERATAKAASTTTGRVWRNAEPRENKMNESSAVAKGAHATRSASRPRARGRLLRECARQASERSAHVRIEDEQLRVRRGLRALQLKRELEQASRARRRLGVAHIRLAAAQIYYHRRTREHCRCERACLDGIAQ